MHERICRAYPGFMGRRVRGAVPAFPLGCGPVCLLQMDTEETVGSGVRPAGPGEAGAWGPEACTRYTVDSFRVLIVESMSSETNCPHAAAPATRRHKRTCSTSGAF